MKCYRDTNASYSKIVSTYKLQKNSQSSRDYPPLKYSQLLLTIILAGEITCQTWQNVYTFDALHFRKHSNRTRALPQLAKAFNIPPKNTARMLAENRGITELLFGIPETQNYDAIFCGNQMLKKFVVLPVIPRLSAEFAEMSWMLLPEVTKSRNLFFKHQRIPSYKYFEPYNRHRLGPFPVYNYSTKTIDTLEIMYAAKPLNSTVRNTAIHNVWLGVLFTFRWM